jgi:gamma-glutamylcyclotransferase (GGCT)/AIG2-like uncharacterized protein YtfP
MTLNSRSRADDQVNLFVYGTLRPPEDATSRDDCRLYPEIAPYVVAAARARLPGADLFDLGAYPGARPGTGTLVGDLLAVRRTGLHLADRMEGHPQFFRRELVTVRTATRAVEAWIYWAPAEIVADRPRITNGDWLQRGKNCA